MVRWDLEQIYEFKDTDVMINNLKIRVKKFTKIKEELNDKITPKRFMELVKEGENIVETLQKIGGYASLKYSENTTSGDNNAHVAKISQLSSEIDNELLFFSHWFKKLSDEKANELIKDSGKYKYYLERARFFRHFMLEENEEKIINIKDTTGCDIVSRLYDIITNQYKFPWRGKNISQSELTKYAKSTNAGNRRKAYTLLLDRYGKEEAHLGEIYKGIVQDWYNENVKLRKFDSPISVRNKSNDIEDSAIETLISVVKKNKDIFQEYFKLKAQLINKKDFSRFDIYAPVKSVEKKYTYEQCKKIVLESYKEFNEKAFDFANEIFEKNHVDSDIRDGKQSGAFCATVKKDIVPYILLNFAGTQRDLFTMMHEFGHGIHGRAAKDQTEYTYHSALPMAETASIFGETILRNKLLKESGSKDKISLLAESLDDNYASIIRQIYFVIFEIEAHKMINDGCTIDDLNKLYYSQLEQQFGDSLEIPEIFKHEWKYIPHIYHSPFYCYAYAFGNLMGLSLYGIYEKEKEKFSEKYMELLAAGGSDSPYNLVKKHIGLDITSEQFWQSGFNTIKYNLEELKKAVEVEEKNKKVK